MAERHKAQGMVGTWPGTAGIGAPWLRPLPGLAGPMAARLREWIAAIACRNSVAVINGLIDLALHHSDPNIRISASKLVLDRAIGKVPYHVAVQADSTHRFVLISPPVMSSADEWERKYGYPDVVDVTPAKPVEIKPHTAYSSPELPAIPQPEGKPVPSGRQGHVGAARLEKVNGS